MRGTRSRIKFAQSVGCGLLLWLLPSAFAQKEPDATYSRQNTFSGFTEYSNDSSHIILGVSENRKLGAIGLQYQHRLVHRRLLDLSYTAEVRPLIVESDPTQIDTVTYTSPTASTYQQQLGPVVACRDSFNAYSVTEPSSTGPVTYAYTVAGSCGRRTVVSQGLSPAGFRINLMPRRRLQLTFSTLGGYMFSPQQVPIAYAGAFNYTFEFGGGLEFYRSHTRSMRLEYDVQHFSNKKTADLNPGVDSGMIKLTYAFGH